MRAVINAIKKLNPSAREVSQGVRELLEKEKMEKVLIASSGEVFIPKDIGTTLDRFLEWGLDEEDALLLIKKYNKGEVKFSDRKKGFKANVFNTLAKIHQPDAPIWLRDGAEFDPIYTPIRTGVYALVYPNGGVNILDIESVEEVEENLDLLERRRGMLSVI